ncbi:hypothetical protein [Sphingobium aromaticiconvertens]|uniref:hypothetical protein n=1 Tax=Sphingobium aromaticiconvertens TaxID=365341 RepID=UPI003016C4D7
MFALVAGLVFSIALLLAIGTILAMFALYHDKMVAALLFEPIPKEAPIYQLRIRRPRMDAVERRTVRAAPASPTPVRFVAA